MENTATRSKVEGWTALAETPLLLMREYSFGPGSANSLAVGLPGGRLMLVSPPADLSDREARELSALGEVVALVAINGAHHLGLGPGRRAFPNAVTYALPLARERILKRAKNAGELAPIGDLAGQLGDAVEVVAVDGCKIGDVVVRVHTERGTVLYASDFIANIPALPKNFIFRLMFKLTDSGPGFKVFRIFFKFFTSDAKAARESLIRAIEARPPAILVPAHGEVVARPDLPQVLVSMLRAAI